MADPKPLTRDQLAKFLPDQEAIKRFERLFAVAGDLTPTDVATLYRLAQEASTDAGIADSKANEALDALNRIANALEFLSLAPTQVVAALDGDLTPPAQVASIGTLSDVSNTTPVAGNVLIYDATLRRYINALLSQGTNVVITNADGSITIAVSGAPPIGPAGGVLSGTYPNPGFAVDMATQAELDAHTGATGTSVHGLGTVSTLASDTDGTLVANSDLRIATQKAVKTYVDNAVTGLLDLKGAIDCSTNPNYPAALKGDAYYVNVAGKIGGASGVSVDVGDMIVASADNAGGTQASVGASWFTLEHNLTGALLSANNLSDLANAATARTNLGLGNVENKTFASGIADATHAATSKATPVDADELPLADSASSFSLKRLTWANLKATLLSWLQATVFPAPGAIGATTPGAGSFTTLNSTGNYVQTSASEANATLTTTGQKSYSAISGGGGNLAAGYFGIRNNTNSNLPFYIHPNAAANTLFISDVGVDVIGSLSSTTTGKVGTTLGVGNATPAASGAGISFPATQSASTDANTLDDYEEGSWTPTSVVGSATGAAGRYTKIGNVVYFTGTLTFPVQVDAGLATIGSLPFTATATSGAGGAATVRYATLGSAFTLYVNSAANTVGCYDFAGGGITYTAMSGRRLDFAGHFFVA